MAAAEVVGDANGDKVLDALAAVVDVLEDSGERVATAHERARQLREGRSLGASYAELLTSADGPGDGGRSRPPAGTATPATVSG